MIASRIKTKKPKRAYRSSRVLRFSPYAWAKLLFLRDVGPTEVGGFGICSSDDLLLVEDVELVEQDCTAVSVEFDDDSVADFFDRQVDAGRRPEQFARVWLHTHPGSSPAPSVVDEETFERCFGGVDWAIMFILAEGGNHYARARFNVGPGCDRRLRCRQQYDAVFPGSDPNAWLAEYEASVHTIEAFADRAGPIGVSSLDWWGQYRQPAQCWRDPLGEVSV